MKKGLLTPPIISKLKNQWAKKDSTLSHLNVEAKLYSIDDNIVYYLIATDHNINKFFAIRNKGENLNIGYYDVNDITDKFFRDLSFKPKKASTIFENVLNGDYFEKGGEIKIEIVNKGEEFDKGRYKSVYGDFDEDGVTNMNDLNPYTYERSPKEVEQLDFTKVFSKLLDTKEELNATMDDVVIDLKKIAPKGSTIYARTKTPYSIINKLIKKRLLDKKNPKVGLSDLVGTTIVVNDYKELLKVKRLVSKGALGEIIDFDDYYKNPKDGYRAFHYIILDKNYGVPVEVQLKTKSMKEVNMLSHDAYKNETLNKERLLEVTDLVTKADKGDLKAKLEVEKLLKDPIKLKNSFSK